MINTAEIISGHYQGSAFCVVECDEADDTVIVVYKFVNGTKTLVGSGVLAVGVANINYTENIAIGNILQAYVDEFGKQAGQPVIVYEETTNIKTGWRNPETVFDGTNETSYEDYFAAGGVEIASKYAPESTINNTVVRNGDGVRDFIDFYIEKSYTTAEIDAEIVNVCIVKIAGFSNAIGNPFVSWDGGTNEQTYQKTYLLADNGDHEIIVYPESSTSQSKTVEFNINIATDVPDPDTSAIWSSSYGINPEANRTVFLTAFSNLPLESRLLIIGSESFTAMTGQSGSRWNGTFAYNVPAGTYVGEIRVTGTTAVKTVDVKITF